MSDLAKKYIEDPTNYPHEMTYADAARILDMVFLNYRAARCSGPEGRCLYTPTPDSPPGAVGCAFAVLVPPSMRKHLRERSSASTLLENPELREYFKRIPVTVLTAIQSCHDNLDVVMSQTDVGFRSQMMAVVRLLRAL